MHEIPSGLADVYRSEGLAAGYAFDRPRVHEQIVGRLRLDRCVKRALDIGCGAGLSAAALSDVAETVVGLEPQQNMLTHRRAVAPAARFAVGRAERLPFAAESFDLITAAGSLNYVDLHRFLPEAGRVLSPEGKLIVYDFGEGRRARGDTALEGWFKSFEDRYPSPPGYAMDVRALRPQRYEEFEVSISMTFDGYLRYALTEKPNADREWCQGTLADVFRNATLDVLFDAYLAVIDPREWIGNI
ncbi:MAG TPA: hypothetical protein DGG94_21220 [Micromonosporaceae bacterium]|nr:hypothetical protein [Micromonosporaceae bacterium]HCU52283.1 hypothetical protein [Micromonosporaceae bacterium]